MSLIERYLNINNNNLLDIVGQELFDNITTYQENYVLYQNNPVELKTQLINKLHKYVDNIYELLCIDDVDINYYLEHIELNSKTKFNKIIRELRIDNIISMMDYRLKEKNQYKYFRNEYYKYFNTIIINGKYKINNTNETKILLELISENWSNITFDNLLNFTSVLNRMKYYEQNINAFKNIYQEKFNSKENIKKLSTYITTNFVEENDNKFNEEDDDNNFGGEKRFNFRFVIDNLKSNGFELFEEYREQIMGRYVNVINREQLLKDKKLIFYFMRIISEKESSTVNRVVNEMLIKIRDYLYDIEDSYNANQDYQRIKIDLQSEKYRDFDLSSLRRDKHNFAILKYLFGDDTNLKSNFDNYKLNKNIEPYFDIFRAYYSNRYPDRKISFDMIKSSITVELSYDKTYYIHMSMIQYIILDIVMNNPNGLTIGEIHKFTGIPIGNLKEPINSLLKIKLIGKTSGTSIDTVKIIENPNFNYEKNKISIYSLVQTDKSDTKSDNKPREFLHDRNIIVYANLIDWVKKNKFFYKDTIIESIKYKIPFGITNDQLDYAISQGLKDDIIKEISVNKTEYSDHMYQYVE
jgi:hypothetical protein